MILDVLNRAVEETDTLNIKKGYENNVSSMIVVSAYRCGKLHTELENTSNFLNELFSATFANIIPKSIPLNIVQMKQSHIIFPVR